MSAVQTTKYLNHEELPSVEGVKTLETHRSLVGGYFT